jgi:hypothetical protein
MSALSLSIIAPKDKVQVTATDKILDQGERTSELATIARALQDGIESLLSIHARMIGKADANGEGGSITIVVDTSNVASVMPVAAPQKPAPAPAPAPDDQRVPQAA